MLESYWMPRTVVGAKWMLNKYLLTKCMHERSQYSLSILKKKKKKNCMTVPEP